MPAFLEFGSNQLILTAAFARHEKAWISHVEVRRRSRVIMIVLYKTFLPRCIASLLDTEDKKEINGTDRFAEKYFMNPKSRKLCVIPNIPKIYQLS